LQVHPRVARVLDELQLLRDDTTPAIRAWIDRRTSELPAGFAGHVRAWLLVVLDGDARARARSHCSLYVYYGAVRPLLQDWAASAAICERSPPATSRPRCGH
jgi:hypothetical protein